MKFTRGNCRVFFLGQEKNDDELQKDRGHAAQVTGSARRFYLS
jgi:hypothetical protein